MPALHENLISTEGNGFLDFLVQLRETDHVAVGILFRPPESAKLAVDVADVGVVDVPIHDVGHRDRPATVVTGGPQELASSIRQGPQFFQGQGIQLDRFVRGHPRTVPNPLQQIVE